MPDAAWRRAVLSVRSCDVMLVVGSSLQVTPAAYLPQEALDRGGSLVIVNREATPYDRLAGAVIHGDAGQVLPEIVAALGGVGAPVEEAPRRAMN